MESIKNIYYKVVRPDLTSFGATFNINSVGFGFLPKKYVVKYKIGEWVYPAPGTKLFVFDNLQEAKKWTNTRDERERFLLFECEVENPKVVSYRRFPCCPRTNIEIERFWDFYKTNPNHGDEEGHVGCSAVKLIRKLCVP